MNSQKLENLLNLALDSTMEEREKSLDLDVGYEAAEERWELIVKYNGDLSRLNGPVITVEELIAGYAAGIDCILCGTGGSGICRNAKKAIFFLAKGERSFLYSASDSKGTLFKRERNPGGSYRLGHRLCEYGFSE